MPTSTKKRKNDRGADDDESEAMSVGSPMTMSSDRKRVQHGSGRRTKVELNMAFLQQQKSLWQQGMEQINEQSDLKLHAIIDEVPLNPDKLFLGIAEHLRSQDEMESRYKRTPGRVVAMGSDDCNQLGLVTAQTEDDDKKDSYPPTLVSLLLSNIVQVSAGGLHSAARTNDGKVYTWGCNDKGVLGRTTKNVVDEAVAEVIDESQMDPDDRGKIVGMSAGESHSLFLTIRGNVYMTGMLKDADSGEFRNIPKGVPHKECEGKNEVAIKVDGLTKPVRAISSGGSFNAAILQDCSLVTWGMGHSGELARSANMTNPSKDSNGNTSYELGKPLYTKEVDQELKFLTHIVNAKFLTPLPPVWAGVPTQKQVLAVACGSYHILVSARNVGEFHTSLYTSGLNQYGQLGHGDTVNRHELTVVKALDRQHIVKVGGGEHFSIAMNIQGSIIWSWGRSDYGQLGRFDAEQNSGHFESTPQPVSFPDTSGDGKGGALLFADIDASDRGASAISDQGEVYTWGFGETGVTGVDGPDLLRPQKLNISTSSKGGQDMARVHNVSGGGQHTLMVIS